MDDLLDCATDLGCTVGRLRLLNDHYLVQKIRIKSMSGGMDGAPVLLPDVFIKKSVGNLCLIKALVIRSSEPYRSKHVVKRIVGWDSARGDYRYQYPIKPGTVVDPKVQPGDFILYNSYNVGKIGVAGLDEPLMIVRGIDIEAVISDLDDVQIGDFAMSKPGEA